MNTTRHTPASTTRGQFPRHRWLWVTGTAFAAAVLFGACSTGGASTTATPAPAPTPTTPASATANSTGQTDGSPVLPVAANPISNDSTVDALSIDSVLVENNVDASGAAVDDHLEVALSNTGTSPLSGFEVFATYTDTVDGTTENYYWMLPDGFTIEPGAGRTAHFDNTGAPDHFAVNQFSLYATSVNALDVEVTVSAQDAAIQTATVKKDAGGAEVPD